MFCVDCVGFGISILLNSGVVCALWVDFGFSDSCLVLYNCGLGAWVLRVV